MYKKITFTTNNYPDLDERKYKKNHFIIKPSKDYANMMFLYFHEEIVGFISTYKVNILRNGHIKTIFFWITQAEICNNNLTILKDNIGQVLFIFNENSKKWKLSQITLTEVPGNFLPLTRKIMIEKMNDNKYRLITTNPCLEIQL